MSQSHNLRSRKKAQTRERIADVAASLFAEQGYDAVSMAEVARAADVSDQTVYNYFPTKPELVLDRAGEFRARYTEAITQRDVLTSPAAALQPLVAAAIERYRTTDLDVARGEFAALSVASSVLRRFTLEERERQVHVIADAIAQTYRTLPAIVTHAHAASLVAVLQVIDDEIGAAVLERKDQNVCAEKMHATVGIAFTCLDRAYVDLNQQHQSSRVATA